MSIPTFTTKQYTLRAHRKSDAPSVVHEINDPVIARNTAHIPYPYGLPKAHAWIKQCQSWRRQKPLTDITWVIDVAGQAVGAVALHHIVPRHQAEVGYWLGRTYRGQGIMTSAVAQVSRWAFRELRMRRLYASTYVFNPASARVLKKNGFVYEGRQRKGVKKNGRLYDILLFAKVI